MIILLILSVILNVTLIFLLIRNSFQRKRKKLNQIKKEGTIGSGSDLFNDIIKSKELFNLLKREIHPERFIGNESLMKYAEQKMMRLGEISNSYTQMRILIQEMQNDNFPFTKKINSIK
jgi:hypothetical protein